MGYKVLGQAAPAANASTDLFTAVAQTVCSSLVLCNRGAEGASFRVQVRPGGAASANAQTVLHNVPLAPGESLFFTVGFTLAVGDVVTVICSSADISASLFGQEV